MNTLGKHVILELGGCSPEALNSYETVKEAMLEGARRSRATVLNSTFHRFNPQGISATVVVSESHLAIHTWPEYGYASLDIYTCGDTDPVVAAKYIAEKLGAKKVKVTIMKRGIPTSDPQKYEHKALALEGDTSLFERISSWDELEKLIEGAEREVQVAAV